MLDGYREREQSWSELLLDLKRRGLAIAPKVAVGDAALGFWAALRKVFPETPEQRCWVSHEACNFTEALSPEVGEQRTQTSTCCPGREPSTRPMPLTAKGKAIGGGFRTSPQIGGPFLWPENLLY